MWPMTCKSGTVFAVYLLKNTTFGAAKPPKKCLFLGTQTTLLSGKQRRPIVLVCVYIVKELGYGCIAMWCHCQLSVLYIFLMSPINMKNILRCWINDGQPSNNLCLNIFFNWTFFNTTEHIWTEVNGSPSPINSFGSSNINRIINVVLTFQRIIKYVY